MPTISIITVNLNDRSGLERTLNSVVNQKEVSPEIIVIDGNSTDGSREVVDRYKDHLTYWVSEPDSGIYQAMNKGIARATADYLLFLNSGDYLLDDPYVLQKASEDLDADIVAFDCHIAQKGIIRGTRQHRGNPSLYYVYKNGLKHQSTFIKRELFDRLGLYDESYRIAGDYEFWIRALLDPMTSLSFKEKVLAVFELGGISQNSNWGIEHNRIEKKWLTHLREDFEVLTEANKFMKSRVLLRLNKWYFKLRKLIK